MFREINWVILLSAFFLIFSCDSKRKRALVGETEYQIKLNSMFKDGSKSPLKKKDLKNFKGLDFFPFDSSYIINARFIKTKDAPFFKMKTNTEREPLYKEYGVLKFILKNKSLELTVYQSQEELNDENYKESLYLPFTDNTSGVDSYGGGRYMDLNVYDIKKDSSVLLNFNNTYNPYCVYNEKFSCPITPRKNHLDIEINAGIKDFKHQ